MALIDSFIKGARRERLDIATVKRFPYLVWTNVILILFFVFASYSRFRVDPAKYGLFFGLVVGTTVTYPVSIMLLRFYRLKASSYLSANAMLVNILWLGIFLPAPGPTYIYRFVAMLTAANIANLLISLSDRQIVLFACESGAFFIVHSAVCMFRASADAPELASDTRTALAVGAILFICSIAMIILARKHSATIIKMAESEMKHNRDKLEELRALLRGAEDSFEIGHYLKKRVDESARMFAAIEKALDRINAEARSLVETASGCRESNLSIMNFAESMKSAVVDQNSSLDETSASIHEVVATIDSIGKISRDKQGGIRSLVDDLDSKRGHYRNAREGIARIDRASSRVAGALGAILDISERVNLLAMNASIEAAHLGASGKGFAVISQEMRTLSEKTRSSAKEIESSLDENMEAVRSASVAIVGFTDEIELVNDECRKALDGIDEILNGVQEISIGNREIQQSTVNLVDISKKTETSVGGVLSRMEMANESIGHIDSFARELSEKIMAIDSEFKGIRALMEDIDQAGARNEDSISDLKAGMETAGRG